MSRATLRSSISLDDSKFKKGTKGVNNSLDTVKSSLGKMKGLIGSAFAVGAIIAFAKKAGQAADEILNLKDATLTSTDSIQALRRVADESGTSFSNVASAYSRLNDASAKALNGNKKFEKTFKDLNIEVEDFFNLDPDKKLEAIAKALKLNEGEAGATQAKYDLLGKGADQLNGVLNELGKEGLQGTIELMKELGVVTDETALKSLDRMNDSTDRALERAKSASASLLGSIVIAAENTGDRLGDLLYGDSIESALEVSERIRKRKGITLPIELELEAEEVTRKKLEAREEALKAARKAESEERAIEAQKLQDQLFALSDIYEDKKRKQKFDALSDTEKISYLEKDIEYKKSKALEAAQGGDGIKQLEYKIELLDLESQLLKLTQDKADAEKEIAQVTKDKIQKEKEEREEKRKALIDDLKQLRKDGESRLADIRSGATSSVGAIQPRIDLNRIGGYIGGANDPMTRKVEIQIQIAKQQAKLLKEIRDARTETIATYM